MNNSHPISTTISLPFFVPAAQRFTNISKSRVKLIELKWEQMEMMIAKEARDRHVLHLLQVRKEKELQLLQQEREYMGEDGEEKDSEGTAALATEGQEKDRNGKRTSVNGRRITGITRRVSGLDTAFDAPKTTLDFTGSAGNVRGGRGRKRSSASGTSHGMSPFVMKNLMEDQLKNALGVGGFQNKNNNNDDGGGVAGASPSNTDWSNYTIEEMATYLTKYLDAGNQSMVNEILEAVNHSHDDLDTPSGGIHVEDFLKRVTGEIRTDAIRLWMKNTMFKIRNDNHELYNHRMDLWRNEVLRVDVTETKRMMNAMLVGGDEEGGGGGGGGEEGFELKSLVARGYVKVGLNDQCVLPKPQYPGVLLLTGEYFDYDEFKHLVIHTLDVQRFG